MFTIAGLISGLVLVVMVSGLIGLVMRMVGYVVPDFRFLLEKKFIVQIRRFFVAFAIILMVCSLFAGGTKSAALSMIFDTAFVWTLLSVFERRCISLLEFFEKKFYQYE